ncbi:MAG: YggT family protein, partial [Actinomycetota bacterium]|nr:YggT family protein [Actinomycetota bacterium]
MGLVFGLIYIVLLFIFVALIVRLVFDWVQMFA